MMKGLWLYTSDWPKAWAPLWIQSFGCCSMVTDEGSNEAQSTVQQWYLKAFITFFLEQRGILWDSKKTRNEEQLPREVTLSSDNSLQMIRRSPFSIIQNNQKQIQVKSSLPVSVKRASDVQRIGTSFVVSSGAKSIHKATVGKRCLYMVRDMVSKNK